LSDYACGTVDPKVIDQIRRLRQEHPRTLAVDARDVRRIAGIGATVVTPNLDEARAATPAEASIGSDPETVARALRETIDAEHIAITLASGGVMLVDRAGETRTLPTSPVPRAGDVGAGDSF